MSSPSRLVRAVLLSAVPPLLLLAGCVAPEEPVTRRAPRPAAVQAPLPANLQPAPTADRKLKAPEGSPIVKVDGLPKSRKSESPL